MPKKLCPFFSTSGCFHLLTFALFQASVGSLHSLNQLFLRQHFPTGRYRELFLGKQALTSLLTILSATSSALTLLNASLILPSFAHRLVQATSVATNGSFYPSPPLPNLLPMHWARQEAPGPFLRDQEGLSGVQRSSRPSLAAGLRKSLKVQLTHTGAPSCPLPPLCLWL